MKYIRTQVGIFEDKFVRIKVDKQGNAVMEYKGKYYEPPLSVKQANTIDELIDEYVIHYANGYHLITINDGEITFKDDFDYGFKLKFVLENEIYGAIWTDKGLIYVAKMNEKGELELL